MSNDYTAPDYASANEAAVQASAQNVSPLAKIQAAKTLGTQAILSDSDLKAMGLNPASYQKSGNGYLYSDFTGVGDDVLQKNTTDAYLNAIKATTPALLDIQKQYGTDYAEQARKEMETADPEKFAAYKALSDKIGTTGGLSEDADTTALRKAMGSQLLSDVQAGTGLTDAQRKFSEQQTRSAQVARGNLFGNAPSIEETLNALNLGESLKNSRMTAANNFLSSGQDYETASNRLSQGNIANLSSVGTNTPISSYFSGLQGAQQGASGQNATGYNQAGFNVGDSISQVGNLASSIYGTNANIYNTQAQTSVSPAMAALGVGTQLGSAYLMGK